MSALQDRIRLWKCHAIAADLSAPTKWVWLEESPVQLLKVWQEWGALLIQNSSWKILSGLLLQHLQRVFMSTMLWNSRSYYSRSARTKWRWAQCLQGRLYYRQIEQNHRSLVLGQCHRLRYPKQTQFVHVECSLRIRSISEGANEEENSLWLLACSRICQELFSQSLKQRGSIKHCYRERLI